jgi:hypothetical protein
MPFQVTSGHCFLIFDETSEASSLNFLGSSNASGEKRLRIMEPPGAVNDSESHFFQHAFELPHALPSSLSFVRPNLLYIVSRYTSENLGPVAG